MLIIPLTGPGYYLPDLAFTMDTTTHVRPSITRIIIIFSSCCAPLLENQHCYLL